MTAEKFSNALGLIGETYILEAASCTSRKKSTVLPKWAAIAACLLLIIGSIFGVPSLIDFMSGDDPVLPTDINKIIWGSDNHSNSNGNHTDAFVEWNGWTMDYALYAALDRARETDYIAVLVKKNDVLDRGSFEHNGITYGDLQAEQEALHAYENKLLEFSKMGESLKYGQLLYTTGTPGGEKWTKEFYDETVAYYGEDFIAKYIVDGEFLKDRLDEDQLACQNRIAEIRNEIDELNKAYNSSYVNEVADIFASSGACVVSRNGHVFLFVQKSELAGLKISGKENYLLSLAKSSMYDDSTTNSND